MSENTCSCKGTGSDEDVKARVGHNLPYRPATDTCVVTVVSGTQHQGQAATCLTQPSHTHISVAVTASCQGLLLAGVWLQRSSAADPMGSSGATELCPSKDHSCWLAVDANRGGSSTSSSDDTSVGVNSTSSSDDVISPASRSLWLFLRCCCCAAFPPAPSGPLMLLALGGRLMRALGSILMQDTSMLDSLGAWGHKTHSTA